MAQETNEEILNPSEESIKRGVGKVTATYTIEVNDKTEDVDVEWIAVVDEDQDPTWEKNESTSDYINLDKPYSPTYGDYGIGSKTIFWDGMETINNIEAVCDGDSSISYPLGSLPEQGGSIWYNGEDWTIDGKMFNVDVDADHVEPDGDNDGYTNLIFSGGVELMLSRMDENWNSYNDSITLNVDTTQKIEPQNGGFDIEIQSPRIDTANMQIICDAVEKYKVLGEWKYAYKWELADEDDDQYGVIEPSDPPMNAGDTNTTQGSKTTHPYKYLLDDSTIEYDPELGNNGSNYIRIDGEKPEFAMEILGGEDGGRDAEPNTIVEKSFNYVEYPIEGDVTWPTRISQINISPKENTGGTKFVKLNAGNNWEGTLVSYRKPLVIEGTEFHPTDDGTTNMVHYINAEYANDTIDEANLDEIYFPMEHGYIGNGSEVTYSFTPDVPVSSGIRTFETSETYTFTYKFTKSQYRDDEGLNNMSQVATLHVVIADIDSIEFDVNGTHYTANSGNNWKVNVEVASGSNITLSNCVVNWSDGTTTTNPASKMSGVISNVTTNGEVVYSAWGYDQLYPQSFTLNVTVKNEEETEPSSSSLKGYITVCGRKLAEIDTTDNVINLTNAYIYNVNERLNVDASHLTWNGKKVNLVFREDSELKEGHLIKKEDAHKTILLEVRES